MIQFMQRLKCWKMNNNVGVATDLESATVTEEDILEDIKVTKEEIKKIE